MRIIFLDIDGVLNDINLEKGKLFRQKAVQVLADIVHQSDATIVLSSTWKRIKDYSEEKYPDAYHMWQELVNTLAQYGMEIFDVTPDRKGDRPLEIVEWLKIHENLNISSWVSIDDDFSLEDYAKYGVEDHLFRTHFFVCKDDIGGLVPEHIPKILRMFEEHEKERK